LKRIIIFFYFNFLKY